jgi:hypothetical protein
VVQVSRALRVVRSVAKWIGAILAMYLVGVYGHFLFNGMPYDPNASTYVTIDPKDTDRFLSDLGEISKDHGLTPWRGSATPDHGRTLYVFEATGLGLNIWSQNVTMSGHECAQFPGVGSDPGQFTLHALPAVWLPIRQRATELFERVRTDLLRKGYRLSAQATTPCDPSRLNELALVPPNPSLERP